MTSGWPKSLLLLCCSTFDHVILYFPRAGHHLKENKRRTRRASLLFPAVFNAKGHIQTKLSTFRAWSFSPYIYYKFALGTKPIKWSCPAGTAHWMFTLKQNNCPLFPPHVPPLLNDCCSTESASGYTVHSVISQWWNPLVACLDCIPCEVAARCHCYSKHATNPYTCVGFCCASEQELRQ